MPHSHLQAEAHLPASPLTPGAPALTICLSTGLAPVCQYLSCTGEPIPGHRTSLEAALVGMFLLKGFWWYLNFLGLRLGVNALLCPYRRYSIHQPVHYFLQQRLDGSADHSCRYVICWWPVWTVLPHITGGQQRSHCRYSLY